MVDTGFNYSGISNSGYFGGASLVAVHWKWSLKGHFLHIYFFYENYLNEAKGNDQALQRLQKTIKNIILHVDDLECNLTDNDS